MTFSHDIYFTILYSKNYIPSVALFLLYWTEVADEVSVEIIHQIPHSCQQTEKSRCLFHKTCFSLGFSS